MDYKLHYELLIKTRRNRVLESGAYYENHHILPLSMGGSNCKDNLIRLTAREHYVAHLLLYKFSNSVSMVRAFVMISSRFKITGRIYEEARLLKNKTMPKKEEHWCWGKSREDASKRMKEKNPMRCPEMRKKVSLILRGRKNPPEASKKSALARTGPGNSNYRAIKSTNLFSGESVTLGLIETATHFGVDRELIYHRLIGKTVKPRKLKDWTFEYADGK